MLFGGAVMLTTLIAGSVQAEEGGVAAKQGDLQSAAVTSELQRQERELDRTIGALAQVGTELEEAQGRVDGAKAHQEALGRRVQELDAALEAQKEASVRSSSRLEDRLRFAYKGGELEGLLLLLAGFFGGNDIRSSPFATLQATRLITESGRSIQDYKETKQRLRSTLRQVEETRAEYREFGEESQESVQELKGRKLALRASVEGLGFRSGLLEERLVELTAEEEAGLLERPPATGVGEEGEAKNREDVRNEGQNRDGKQNQDGKRNRDEVREPRGEEREERAREWELEIARDDIESRPVAPTPYEEYIRLYRASAQRYGFGGDWYVLAAVGKIESNHGENVSPSGAGVMGPMQFLA